ncbi:MAG: hypothetical protein GKR93_12230 [Gammaproteobacteria bacterium]|nr:hypothetical protein [Gammaproteobacteria bacterium]
MALATSQIHRSRTLGELQQIFLNVVPRFVNADAYGLYLFDDKLQTSSLISHQANQDFLSEYEKIRSEDPLFNFLLNKKRFTHSLDIFDEKEWSRQPLHEFLTQWGLDYSIEAPLICDGRLKGTLNFALGGNRYFADESLIQAEFLCAEFEASYQRLDEIQKLKKELSNRSGRDTSYHELSRRGTEVLELLLCGNCNRAIADKLNISENTVRYHIKQIYEKFDVHNRAQLVKRVYVN